MENKNHNRKKGVDKDKILDETELSLNRKEKDEDPKEKMICNSCGNDTFRVYCTVIIDDARLYCTKCGKDPEE